LNLDQNAIGWKRRHRFHNRQGGIPSSLERRLSVHPGTANRRDAS
jgi:hypothetical protein